MYKDRFYHFHSQLRIQGENACLLCFQEFSDLPIPYNLERPLYGFEDLKRLTMQRPLNYQKPILLNENYI